MVSMRRSCLRIGISRTTALRIGTGLPFSTRIARMSTTTNGSKQASLGDIPKSNVFTSSLPPDPAFETPEKSHNAPREKLGPRMVKNALYTYVRPEPTHQPELLAVSPTAMKDIGMPEGEEHSAIFRDTVAGNHIFWDESRKEGVYPWAQCYGGIFIFIPQEPSVS